MVTPSAQIHNSVHAQSVARQFSFTRFATFFGLMSAGLCLLPCLSAAQRRTDDPAPPPAHQSGLSSLSIADNMLTEGDEGASVLRFRVSIDPVSLRAITLSYRVGDHSARSAGSDYQAISGTITIPANVSSTEIPVTVFGDKASEMDETFLLVLTSAINANIVDATATGTIADDDAGGGGGGEPRRLPADLEGGDRRRTDPIDTPSPQDPFVSVSIADNRMSEGNVVIARPRDARGTGAFCFKVHVFPESSVPITVTYRLLDRSARCDQNDYQGADATITIPAHVTSTEIAVTVFSDDSDEADETFMIVLSSATNAQIARRFATGVIFNDDFQGGGGGPLLLPEAVSLGTEKASFALACANPVRGRPSFQFALARPAHVSIVIYDLAGRMVDTQVDGVYGAGKHLQSWTQAKPAPGIYLARFRSEGQTITQRINWMD